MVEMSSVQVMLLGMGIVFFGLVCIVVLTTIMGAIMKSVIKPAAPAAAVAAPAAAPAAPVVNTAKEQEIVAVITAVLSDELAASNGVITAIKKA